MTNGNQLPGVSVIVRFVTERQSGHERGLVTVDSSVRSAEVGKRVQQRVVTVCGGSLNWISIIGLALLAWITGVISAKTR